MRWLPASLPDDLTRGAVAAHSDDAEQRHDTRFAAERRRDASMTSAPNNAVDSSDDIGNVSVGQLFADVSNDLSTLMRQEVELAKAEVKAEVAKAGKGAGMLGGAGFAGYMVLMFLSFALWWGLANVMDTGLAAIIVAARLGGDRRRPVRDGTGNAAPRPPQARAHASTPSSRFPTQSRATQEITHDHP